MWFVGFPQQQPYRFHCRNRVMIARRHLFCKSVAPFDKLIVVQRNLSAAANSEYKQELDQVTAVKLESLAPKFMTASKQNVVCWTFFVCVPDDL
jgi:hypothetical protein